MHTEIPYNGNWARLCTVCSRRWYKLHTYWRSFKPRRMPSTDEPCAGRVEILLGHEKNSCTVHTEVNKWKEKRTHGPIYFLKHEEKECLKIFAFRDQNEKEIITTLFYPIYLIRWEQYLLQMMRWVVQWQQEIVTAVNRVDMQTEPPAQQHQIICKTKYREKVAITSCRINYMLSTTCWLYFYI